MTHGHMSVQMQGTGLSGFSLPFLLPHWAVAPFRPCAGQVITLLDTVGVWMMGAWAGSPRFRPVYHSLDAEPVQFSNPAAAGDPSKWS